MTGPGSPDDQLKTAPRATLSGYAPGIVAVREGARRKLYTLQCEGCLATEEPEHLFLMTMKFHPRSQGKDNPRLCRLCRIKAYPDCTCGFCREDRGGSEFS